MEIIQKIYWNISKNRIFERIGRNLSQWDLKFE